MRQSHPVLAVFLCSSLVFTVFGEDKPKAQFPGPTDKGFLLPNGWTLTPAGKHVVLTDLPLNILPLADSKHALVATSGFNKHELSLIDLTTQKVVDQQTVRESWFGLALSPKEDRIWWSGAGANMLHTFDLKDHKLTRTSKDEIDPSKLTAEEKAALAKQREFKSGVLLDLKKNVLYSLDINKSALAVVSVKDGGTVKTAELEG